MALAPTSGRWRIYLAVAVILAAAVSTHFASEARDANANSASSTDANHPVDLGSLDMIPLEIWGVSGLDSASTQTPSFDVLVWDIQQVGDRVFVAGGFLNVQEDEDSASIPQPYLAAFDLNTTEWISSCTPSFDRAVYALSVNRRGRLIVGGEFTMVNGTDREALVALDPITCEIDSGFSGSLERPWSTKRAMVRSLEVVGDDLYVVGNFSHANGPGSRQRVHKAVRMNANWGTLDTAWKPEVSGSSIWGIGVDESLGRVHLVGFFTSVNGLPDSGYFHTVDTATGTSVTGLVPLPRNAPHFQLEMFDVVVGNGLLFVAGEQHMTQVLDVTDHQMLGFHHTGNTGSPGFGFERFAYTSAFAGGGYQVAERVGDVVFAGCHCTFAERFGHLAHYSSFSDTRTAHKLVMAYDATSGHLIESFNPDVTSPRDGTWAVASDTNGCLYLGGDFNGRGIDAGLGGWAGGFVKLCPAGWHPPEADQPDTQPPSVPQGLSTQGDASSVSLSWGASSDNVGLQSYLVYRDGAYLGWTSAGVTSYVDASVVGGLTYLYEVRAVDLAANRSAKSDVASATAGDPDTQPPSVPQGLSTQGDASSVSLSWGASSDNVGLQSYLVYRDGAYLGWTSAGVTSYVDASVVGGLTYLYEVRAVDLAANRSAKSDVASATAGDPDNEAPSVPSVVAAVDNGDQTVTLDWDASSDNVGIRSYLVYRNGAYLGWTDAATTTFVDDTVIANTTYSYNFRAVDLADNRSAKSDSVQVTVS